MYDVYYTTGGGPYTNAGTDKWVNDWLELISPKLDVKPILLIHRNKPNNFDDFNYEFPIETYWHGDDVDKFEELCNSARRIHILHGHYTPMKVLEENKSKIFSNVLHNSVDHILKSEMGTDSTFIWHPYMDSSWEREINDIAKHSIWVGLYQIRIENKNIPNFYEFKNHLELSDSKKLGFAARCEGRKNPRYLDGIPSYIFTNSYEFNAIWKEGVKVDIKKSKLYHYNSAFKNTFYNMDWGISHSCFTNEPFGYSIFESVDYGKLPILHKTWCKDFEYPFRASTKTEFKDIYDKLSQLSYDEKNHWFQKIKSYMIDNFSDKDKWVNQLLDIYNI
jgi:hypothetical protein